MAGFINTDEFRNTLFSWPEKTIRYLYQDYYDRLLKIADMYTHDRGLSEDAVQEVFTDISQRHKELGRKHQQPFHTYLIRAVTNHAITLYRKNLRSNLRDTQYFYTTQSMGPPEKNPEAKMIAAEKRSFLRVVIGTLPPREKECFLMRTEGNLSVREIARRLRLSVKTVDWYLNSARKRLRKYGPRLD